LKDEERTGEVAINLDLSEKRLWRRLLHLYFDAAPHTGDMTFTGENAQKIWQMGYSDWQ